MKLGRMGASVGAIAVLASATVAFATTNAPAGSVHQAPGQNGCYTATGASEAGPGTCHNIRGGGESTTLTVSPDGRFAYLDGYGTGSTAPAILAVFRRNTKTGVLTQLSGKSGCFSGDGSSEDGPNTCTKARDIDSGDATSIVISRDGRFLYVASQLRVGLKQVGGIAVFSRNLKNGKLRQLSGKAGCVTAVAYKGCTVAREVDLVSSLHITPDQKFLYASRYGVVPKTGIAIFRRDSKSGALQQLKGANGCLSTDGTTADSGHKKVCRVARNLSDPWDVATPDNRFAYIPAATNGGNKGVNLVQAFKRNSQGGLVPLTGKGSCVSDTGTSPAGSCVHGRGLVRPERAVLSKNGHFIYINSYGEGTGIQSPVAVLDRNPKTGLLSQRKGPSACISATGTTGDGATCQDGRALDGGYAGVLSPDGRTLYFSEYVADGLAIFRVSPKTGAVHQLRGQFGCVTKDGSSEDGPGTCESGRAVAGAYQVALGSRGRDVYVTGDLDNGVALFHASN